MSDVKCVPVFVIHGVTCLACHLLSFLLVLPSYLPFFLLCSKISGLLTKLFEPGFLDQTFLSLCCMLLVMPTVLGGKNAGYQFYWFRSLQDTNQGPKNHFFLVLSFFLTYRQGTVILRCLIQKCQSI